MHSIPLVSNHAGGTPSLCFSHPRLFFSSDSDSPHFPFHFISHRFLLSLLKQIQDVVHTHVVHSHSCHAFFTYCKYLNVHGETAGTAERPTIRDPIHTNSHTHTANTPTPTKFLTASVWSVNKQSLCLVIKPVCRAGYFHAFTFTLSLEHTFKHSIFKH